MVRSFLETGSLLAILLSSATGFAAYRIFGTDLKADKRREPVTTVVVRQKTRSPRKTNAGCNGCQRNTAHRVAHRRRIPQIPASDALFKWAIVVHVAVRPVQWREIYASVILSSGATPHWLPFARRCRARPPFKSVERRPSHKERTGEKNGTLKNFISTIRFFLLCVFFRMFEKSAPAV